MTVKDTLLQLFQDRRSGTLPAGDVDRVMQRRYPGEYVIREMYDRERMCFGFQPIFKDPRKEILWRIKYGY